MGDTCLPGLQGFPVQVSGWPGGIDKVSLVVPNDIELQFSPSQTPMAFDKQTGALNFSGSNSFFVGGTLYNVRSVRLAEPKQNGLASFSGNAVAEFQIWGISGVRTGNPGLAVLTIPLVLKPIESVTGMNIVAAITGNPIRLSDCIPNGTGIDVLKYTSCIETNVNSTININVSYWTNGVPITQEQFSKLPKQLPPAGIPNVFGFMVLTQFVQYADAKQTKGQRKYQEIRNILQPYTASTGISVTGPEFKNGFRLIQNFTMRTLAPRDTSAYKCIAIDRSKDIQKGKLLVDPKTGRRLTDEVDLAESQQSESTEEPSISPRDLWIRVCIIIGTLVGIGLVAAFIIFLGSKLTDNKTMGADPKMTLTIDKFADGTRL
jgi:hypothetical protein